jgi:hypothetical protein
MPVRTRVFFIFLLSLTTMLAVGQQPERQLVREQTKSSGKASRVALVIGNGDYVAARKLANPVNDATDMVRALGGLGFEVISGTNLSLKEMTEKVRQFGDKLKSDGSVGLFYYAGHGVQVGGRNYLIPVEADIPREDEIDFNAFNVDLVLRKMGTANNGLNIVILDACRNNPFARSWSRGDTDGGLAQMTAPTGSFIAYATAPDRTASDGGERNGLYTAELLKVLGEPNAKIEDIFKKVTIAVDRASNGQQIPWTSSSLRGEFYFNVGGVDYKGTFQATVTPADGKQTSGGAGAATSELDAWNKIKESKDSQEFAKFLNQYPYGIFVEPAKRKLLELTGSAGPRPAQPGDPLQSDYFKELMGGSALDAGVEYLDGQNRVTMRIATVKQGYSSSSGVMGIGASFKMLDTLNNARAPLRLKSNAPEFEFTAAANINPADVAFVVRLKSKSDKREIQTTQETFSGFKNEDLIPASFEETSTAAPAKKKVYKLKISRPLPPGEYSIVVRQSIGAIGGFEGRAVGAGVYFDFGVDK